MAAFRFPGIRPAYSLARRIFYGRSLETDGHRRILGFGGDCRHHRHCSGHFGPRGQRRRRRGGRGRKAHLLDHWLCEQHTAVPPTPVPPTSVPYCDLYPLSCITPVRPTAVPPTAIPPTDPPPPTDTPVPPPTNTPKPPPTNTPKPPITVAPPPTSTPRPDDGDANPTNTPRPPTPTPTPGGQTVTLPSSGTVITWPPDDADPTDQYPVPTYAQVVAAANDYFDAPSGIHRPSALAALELYMLGAGPRPNYSDFLPPPTIPAECPDGSTGTREISFTIEINGLDGRTMHENDCVVATVKLPGDLEFGVSYVVNLSTSQGLAFDGRCTDFRETWRFVGHSTHSREYAMHACPGFTRGTMNVSLRRGPTSASGASATVTIRPRPAPTPTSIPTPTNTPVPTNTPAPTDTQRPRIHHYRQGPRRRLPCCAPIWTQPETRTGPGRLPLILKYIRTPR